MLCNWSLISWRGRTTGAPSRNAQVLHAFANPYKVLQISEDADTKQIKKAYRKLALRHHPDISEEPSAEEEFLRIQEAYEILTNKREATQDPESRGWDFHDWYWDFTMSRRWDSHWKKHGKPGPSPFAASPSHRDQWQAQLGGLKQKAAYRRLQQQAKQQAQEADLHWTQQEQQQQQQQHQHQQHSEAEQQSEVQQHQNTQQQATQQQQDQQEVQHAVNTSHSPQALHSNSDQAPVGVNEVHGPPTEMHIANASSGTGRHSSHQSVHHKGAAQPADAFRERTHQLLGQVHACRAQMARRVGSHTAHWPNQLNDILCYALGQFQPDPAATRANHTAQTHGMPDSASHTPSAMPVDIAVAHPSVKAASHGSPAHRQPPNGEQMCQGASVSLSDGQTQAAISEDQMCQGGSVSSSEGRAQGANGVDLQDLSVQHEVKTFDRSTASQAAFQTQHSHVQSQLAGLKRRAARKQDS